MASHTLSSHIPLFGKRRPAYPERQGPRSAGLAGWRADSAAAAPDPALSSLCPGSAPRIELVNEMRSLVPRAALGTAHQTPRPYHSTQPILPTRLLQFASLPTRARLITPAPPLLRAPATLCVFAQPVSSREQTRRRKIKKARRNRWGGVASEDACGTRPVLGLRDVNCADLIQSRPYSSVSVLLPRTQGTGVV